MRRILAHALLAVLFTSIFVWMLVRVLTALFKTARRGVVLAVATAIRLVRSARDSNAMQRTAAASAALAIVVPGIRLQGSTTNHTAVQPGTTTWASPLHPAGPTHQAAPVPMHYQVRDGDTLSSIAAATMGGSSFWPALWWANRNFIPNPNAISAGLTLTIPTDHTMPAGMIQAAMNAIPAPPPPPPALAPAPAPQAAPALQPAQQASSYTGSTSMQRCIIAAESGGNPDIWNASGHWGLYQFSYGTWVAHGGDPALFGNADAEYQTTIFWNTVAVDGYSDWAPYDGC